MNRLRFTNYTTGVPVDFISCVVYDRLDSLSIEVTLQNDYPVTYHQNDSIYVTVDTKLQGDFSSLQVYNLNISEILLGKNSSGMIEIISTIPDINNIITGLNAGDEVNLKALSVQSINDGTIQYNFSEGVEVIVKVYITLSNIKHYVICPAFSYKSVLPTLSNFSIKQSPDSSKLLVTNLNVDDCTDVKHFPESIQIIGDVKQRPNELNNDSDVVIGTLSLDNANNYISNSSTMVPLGANNVPIANNGFVPLTTNSYTIPTKLDSSSGILYNKNNKDVLVYGIGHSKSPVVLNYNSRATNILHLRAPVSIAGVVPHDVINNYGASDSPNMLIMTVTLNTDWTGYEPTNVTFTLVTVVNGIAPAATWIFSTSTPFPYSSNGIYNINLDQMIYIGTSDSSDSATHKLDNNPSTYRLEVSAQWSNINETRTTVWDNTVGFTQDLPPVASVTAYNTWEPMSVFTSSNIVSNDIVIPRNGVTLKIVKNNMHSGNTSVRTGLDRNSGTKFRIQYIRELNFTGGVGDVWVNVPAGYMMQPFQTLAGNSLLLEGATASFNSFKANGSNNVVGNAGLFNLPSFSGYNQDKIGTQQNPIFVYLDNQNRIYDEYANNPIRFRVCTELDSTVPGYNSLSSIYANVQTPLYMINKPMEYSWTANLVSGSVLQPYMNFSSTPNSLVLPMLVGANDVNNDQSIYYSRAYVKFAQNSALTFSLFLNYPANGPNPEFSVDLGSIVKYSVFYEYTNPNSPGVFLNGNLSLEYSVNSQGLPIRSDYQIANDGIKYLYHFNSDSLVFRLEMNPSVVSGVPATTRLDGIEMRIKDSNGNYVQLNNSTYVKTFYNQGSGMFTSGVQRISIAALSLARGALYTLEFKPYRDPLVVTAISKSYALPVDWYETSEFEYLNESNEPVVYSWEEDNGGREPFMDFLSEQNPKIIIPMYTTQTRNYHSATITWLQNSNLGVTNGGPTQSFTTTDALPKFPVTLGKNIIYKVTYNYVDTDGSTTYPGETSGIFIAACQGLPVSSDFTITNHSTDYVYNNSSDKLIFDLDMVPPAASLSDPNVTRIDGVELFITGVNNNEPIATFYNQVDFELTLVQVILSGLSGLVRGSLYQMVFKPFRDYNTLSSGDKVYPASSQWYQPPPFTYLYAEVRDTPLLYSWGTDDISAQPYMDFATGELVIPLDIEQSPNYYGAYVKWYKHDNLGVNVASDAIPVPVVSALQAKNVSLPQFPVTYGTVVIYTVVYVYLSLDGTTQISGTESSRRSLSAQGMPAIDDFTQSPAVNAGVAQYIQDNNVLFPSLIFILDTVDTSNPVLLSHRIDGVVLFIKEEDSISEQYVSSFTNETINSNNGQCLVDGFTADEYLLTPGNTYTLTFKGYRDRRVLNTNASYGSNDFIISDTVISTIDFVFLASPIAPISDDQTSDVKISVSNVISHIDANDKFKIEWPKSKINDVTEYHIYKVENAGTGSESRILKENKQAHYFPAPLNFSYSYEAAIPSTSQKLTYDIQKSYNGRLSEFTRIAFPVGKLGTNPPIGTNPPTITILKQDNSNILLELEDAAMELITELILLDVMVLDNNSKLFPFTHNNGKKNPSGKQNILTIPELYDFGISLLLRQVHQIEWFYSINGSISQKNLDTSYGPPATFVYASRPDISFKDESNINSNVVQYNGRTAIKLKLNASMGLGAPGFIVPSLTSVMAILAQDTSSVISSTQVAGAENIVIFNPPVGGVLQQNSIYSATTDYSTPVLSLNLSDFSNNNNTGFQLRTGDLTEGDTSYIVFPIGGGGYVYGSDINSMLIASNDYGVDTYAKSFFFLISPTFTQNGVIITSDSFTLPSKIVGDASFTPVYPTSNSSGVISYSSSHPLVATVNASSGAITIVGAGSTTITMTQAATASGNYASGSVSGSLVVAPPPDYSVKDLQRIGSYNLEQNGNYSTWVGVTQSSAGEPYGHQLSFYPTSNPANKTVVVTTPASGWSISFNVYPLGPGTNYTVAVTLVNKNTGQELTNLQPVQIITFTTPTPPPPPPVILDTNGVTLKYTSSSIPSGQSNPYIVEVSGISYAVMSDSQDSKTKIRAYADNFWQPINHSAIMPFVANGTIIPFSRIVTTLMTDMSHLFGTFSTNSLFTTQDTYDDLITWDVSNVTNMYMMFRRTQYGGFNPNIVNWDVSNVIDMTGMFQSSVFNRNISQWTVTNVTAYSYFTSMSSLPKTSIPEKFRDTYG
jgi:hypothetical protein